MWMYLIYTAYFKKLQNNPYRYIVAGLWTGASIFLVQVLFNFGVVATLVLFYSFIGLSLAITLHEDYTNDNQISS